MLTVCNVQEYRFLCIRSPDAVKLSVVLTVVMEASVTTSDVQPVGWERNVKGPLVTRTVDLGADEHSAYVSVC